MTKTMLLAGCAIMMGGLSPAIAADTQTRTNVQARGDTNNYIEYSADAETVTSAEVERSVEKAGRTIENTANKTLNALTGTKTKADSSTQANAIVTSNAMIAEPNSAEKMIGKPILGQSGERIGTVHDIILSADGEAQRLIVADGGMLSMGDKKAAFGYNVVTGRDADGNIQTNITEEAIDRVQAFAYDAQSADANTQTLEQGQLSVRDVIGANIAGAGEEKIAVIKDISINQNGAANVLVAHDQFLGLGGKKALVPFGALSPASGEAKADAKFKVSAEQAAAITGNKLN